MKKDKISRRIKVLKEVSIFRNSSEILLEHIAGSLNYFLVPASTTIFHKGDMGNDMFIIESGSVKVHDNDYVFSVLKEEEFFGEYYLIDSEKRSASITTIEETELLQISQSTFYELMAGNNMILKEMLVASVGRLRLMNQIEEQLARKNDEIKKQKTELEQINATRDKFFSILAHDLRSPLTTIISLFDLLNNQLGDLSKNEIVDLIKNINSSTNNVLKLLDNLLQWAQLQTGQLKCHITPLNLRVLAGNNINLLKINAERKGVSLFSEIGQDIWVNADENMINTVFRNLISNAIKFTKSDDSIWITAIKKDCFAEITVHDTGVGIPQKKLKDLFRLDVKNSTPGTAEEQGTGLGLNLCKEFVEENGGEIFVKSQAGKGTRVSFTLPLNSVCP